MALREVKGSKNGVHRREVYLAELKPSRWVGGSFYFGTAFMSTPATEGVKCEDRMTAADRLFNHRSVRLNVLNEIVLPYSNTEQTSITTPGNIGWREFTAH